MYGTNYMKKAVKTICKLWSVCKFNYFREKGFLLCQYLFNMLRQYSVFIISLTIFSAFVKTQFKYVYINITRLHLIFSLISWSDAKNAILLILFAIKKNYFSFMILFSKTIPLIRLMHTCFRYILNCQLI